MNKRWQLSGACYLLAAAALWCEDTFAIAGKVVSKPTGAPITRALVKLDGWVNSGPAIDRASRVTREAFTDAAGAFRFEGLPKGSFTINSTKPQFESTVVDGRRPVEVGPSRDDLTVVMTPLSVIQGTVLDTTGQPMQGVQIKAYTSNIVNGRQTLSESRSVVTDYRGQYRLWNLRAGKFYIKAAGRSAGTALYMTDRAPTYPESESFAPVYYGGATSREQANPIDLEFGQETRADFRLRLEPGYKIRGIVQNLQPYKSARFELRSGREDVTANRASLSAINGTFEVHDVIPGAYVLRVTQGEKPGVLVAEETVQVGAGDSPRLTMRAFGGVDLRIEVEVSGKPDPAEGEPTENLGRFRGNQNWCSVRLTNVTDASQEFMSGPAGQTGNQQVAALPAGEYGIQAECEGLNITGMLLGGTDVLAAQKLVIAPGTQPPPLIIQASRGGGAIEITREGAANAAGHQLLLAPSFPTAEGPRLIYSERSILVRNLAPGEYVLYVINSSLVPYREAEARQGLRNGVAVRVGKDETAKATIREVAQ